MEEATITINGLRAVRDRLISELKAMQIGIHNMQETLEHQEKLISKLVEEFRQFSKTQTESFGATEKEPQAQFITTLQTNKKEFAASQEQFDATAKSILAAQKNMSMMLETLNYGVRLQQLELQVAQLTQATNPIAL